MEVAEDTARAYESFPVIRGPRTKRLRPASPFSLASTSSIACKDYGSSSSANTSTIEFFQNTEEEEDMANCLILLASGHHNTEASQQELYAAYECKTCNRSFPSFQALGGHRASHKKPKQTVNEDLDEGKLGSNTTNSVQPLVLHTNNNKSKVHGCSICGAEFSSGQALGGHMRRHRNIVASISTKIEYVNDQKSRNGFGFDLNLPAPEEDGFGSNQPPLVFSAPALVDCYY